MVVRYWGNELGYRPAVSQMCFVNFSTEVRLRAKNEARVMDKGLNYNCMILLMSPPEAGRLRCLPRPGVLSSVEDDSGTFSGPIEVSWLPVRGKPSREEDKC